MLFVMKILFSSLFILFVLIYLGRCIYAKLEGMFVDFLGSFQWVFTKVTFDLMSKKGLWLTLLRLPHFAL